MQKVKFFKVGRNWGAVIASSRNISEPVIVPLQKLSRPTVHIHRLQRPTFLLQSQDSCCVPGLCMAHYKSGFDTSFVDHNPDGSSEYGIFQLNSAWCDNGITPTKNFCHMDCQGIRGASTVLAMIYLNSSKDVM
ncbi:lysozyme C isoform X3 [Heterocephalus glaber]|uniref:Lysozyme C isoform X3 n=1 Tax=Heterocephalus glaber TaxID=10181 RepID=A0AAX6S8D3_HETGA|nr:lysozyme C isoform X3 [Heterocephalus glaber]